MTEPGVQLTRAERRRAMYPSRRQAAPRTGRRAPRPPATKGPVTSRSALRTKLVERRHRRRRVISVVALTAVGALVTSGAALSLTGLRPADLPDAALRAVGWSAAAPQTIDGVDSTIASRGVPVAAPGGTPTPTRAPEPAAKTPAPTPSGATSGTSGTSGTADKPGGTGTSGGSSAPVAPDTTGDKATATTGGKATATTGTKDAGTVKADDGQQSTATTSDLCVDYLTGSLDKSSLGYRKLVASANGSDLDMWCTDRVGDLKGILAAPAL